MKLGRLFVVTLILALCVAVPKSKAEPVDFDISTTYNNWTYDATMRTSTNSANKFSAVNWLYSSRGNTHKMWFRVISVTTEKEVGKMLFSGYMNEAFNTSGLEVDGKAMLQARRENRNDPNTRVTGRWIA